MPTSIPSSTKCRNSFQARRFLFIRINKKKYSAEKAAIIHAACWAHARRKFVDVPGHPVVQDVVKPITKLYRIESTLRDKPELDRATYR
jgi:hypothetical protein